MGVGHSLGPASRLPLAVYSNFRNVTVVRELAEEDCDQDLAMRGTGDEYQRYAGQRAGQHASSAQEFQQLLLGQHRPAAPRH